MGSASRPTRRTRPRYSVPRTPARPAGPPRAASCAAWRAGSTRPTWTSPQHSSCAGAGTTSPRSTFPAPSSSTAAPPSPRLPPTARCSSIPAPRAPSRGPCLCPVSRCARAAVPAPSPATCSSPRCTSPAPRAFCSTTSDPSRARAGVARTLRRDELEDRLERLARARGNDALLELRDEARALAPQLGAERELAELDRLIGALLGTRTATLCTPAARARSAGLGYDTDRLQRFELLRAALAAQQFADRSAPPDPQRQFAFYEAYFSNWIEGTIFEIAEAEEIAFRGHIPPQRPADAHDVLGTFEAVIDPRLRAAAPTDANDFESFLAAAHARVMAGRPELHPGRYKEQPNRAGATLFVAPELVRGTLREGFTLQRTLPPGLPRAIYTMLLVAEVHPFVDGNGRVARLAMNAELSAAGLCRIVIPLSYRDDYLGALRALSRNGNPDPLLRVLDRAQRWAAAMTWTDPAEVLAQLRATNALVTPDEADASGLRLREPARPAAGG